MIQRIIRKYLAVTVVTKISKIRGVLCSFGQQIGLEADDDDNVDRASQIFCHLEKRDRQTRVYLSSSNAVEDGPVVQRNLMWPNSQQLEMGFKKEVFMSICEVGSCLSYRIL